MSLPEGFIFSQASLQAYVDCPRLFQLHYVRRKPWPAPAVVPQLDGERHRDRGRAFHRLLQQHAQGVPEATLSGLDLDEDVRRWWGNYLQSPPEDVPDTVVRAELSLSVPIGGHRLAARYDRVGAEPGARIVVLDWKTGFRPPSRSWLARRLQTRVYPYVMTLAGAALNGGIAPSPDQVEMIYWYANRPESTVRFAYGADQFASDGEYLGSLVGEIDARPNKDWELTRDESRCRHCSYRSLCKRGVEVGSIGELEDDELGQGDGWDFDLDLEQVAEVVF